MKPKSCEIEERKWKNIIGLAHICTLSHSRMTTLWRLLPPFPVQQRH